ncbi:MAG: 2-oxoacid:acceptor oxidoreductase subunit alpha [Gemmatimonadota bacterium]
MTSSSPAPGRELRINDFAFKIGTVNGTGSASANGLLMQTIFRMGIPISGKNVFPSNIQGLPTWYEIRVNGRGRTARTPLFDLIVAMNPATYARDVAEVRNDGWLLHDSSWPMDPSLKREDVTFLGIPIGKMCVEHFQGARERILMKNIVYTGALAALFDMDMTVIQHLLEETFAKKKALLDSNFLAVRLGYEYAKEHFECPLPIRLQRLDETSDHIIIDGNTAAALGCVYAGATVGAWYPITPSTSLMDGFTRFCRQFRTDPETGEKNYAIIQAEDELSAAGMVIGANWAGARAFTPTSGPGISLMSEFIGLAYYAEVPSVFFNVQRTGPSTGMPTRTQQGDLMLCAYASHGDTKHIVLFPAHPGESFEMAVASFDLAERYQTPVFVVQDLDIGMNDWMVPRFRWDDSYRPDRGKVLNAEELEAAQNFYRYLDVDGDGIPYRTLPGVHPKGAYFTRGSGHDKYGRYTEDSDAYVEVVDRLRRKVEGAAEALPAPLVDHREGPGKARYGIVSIGACDGAAREALDQLRAEGMSVDYMRIRGFPFAASVEEFLHAHEVNFIVEQNRDAQLRSLLLLETETPRSKLVSVRYYGGLPMSCHHVVDGIHRHFYGDEAIEPLPIGGSRGVA